MKKTLFSLVLMLMAALSCSAQSETASADSVQTQAPQGRLVYCSYSCNRPAGGGKDYCELIADPGVTPTVVVCLNSNSRLYDTEERRFAVADSVVAEAQLMLAELEVWNLNGYVHKENIPGAPTYRIYQEYESGEKFNAVWSGHDIKPEAERAYIATARFFSRWRNQVEQSGPSDN